MKKYERLRAYLQNQAEDVDEVLLTFSFIENLIRDALPASARNHREWWSNEQNPKHGQKRAWHDAGWRTDVVRLGRGEVLFVRDES